MTDLKKISLEAVRFLGVEFQIPNSRTLYKFVRTPRGEIILMAKPLGGWYGESSLDAAYLNFLDRKKWLFVAEDPHEENQS